MFIGHFAVGFGLKKHAPRTSLAWLIGGALLSDMLWVAFLYLGLERARINPAATRFSPFYLDWFPWSHSLLLCIVWGGLLGGMYFAITKYRPGAIAIGVAVLSHWVLDVISHRADMPFYPDSPTIGLGLYNSVPGIMATEIVLLSLGVFSYARVTVARNWVGAFLLYSYLAALLFVFVAGYFAAPPVNIAEVVSSGAVAFLATILWAGGVERNRAPRTAI